MFPANIHVSGTYDSNRYNGKDCKSALSKSCSMHFLDFPQEIRLIIYSKLLIQDSPVEFTGWSFYVPRLIRVGGQGLNPSLLRVSKTVNREAVPFLYSNNRFKFPRTYVLSSTAAEPTWFTWDVPHIAPFLQQIGANADLLRHICIPFPKAYNFRDSGGVVPGDEYFQVLQLIRETCSGLRTVEISCEPEESMFTLQNADRAVKVLGALDSGGFQAMPSLERITVVCGKYDIDEQIVELRESLMRRMPSRKWSIEFIKLPACGLDLCRWQVCVQQL